MAGGTLLFCGGGERRAGRNCLELASKLCSLTCGLYSPTVLAGVSLCSVDSWSVPLTWPTGGMEIHILAPHKVVLGWGLEFPVRRGSG